MFRCCRMASSFAATRSPTAGRSASETSPRLMQERTSRVRASSNSSSSIPSRNVRKASRAEPRWAGTPSGGGTLFLSPAVSMPGLDHHTQELVARVGWRVPEPLHHGVEVEERSPVEEPGILAVGLPHPVEHDPAAVIGVPDVPPAVGIADDLLGKHEPAPLDHERELARHLRPTGRPAA